MPADEFWKGCEVPSDEKQILMIENLIQLGGDINKIEKGHVSNLTSAISRGQHPSIIKKLIEAGAQLNAEADNPEKVKTAIVNADLGIKQALLCLGTEHARSIFMHHLNTNKSLGLFVKYAGAVTKGKRKADRLAKQAIREIHVLHYQIKTRCSPDHISALLHLGADPTQHDKQGKTAAQYATELLETVKSVGDSNMKA